MRWQLPAGILFLVIMQGIAAQQLSGKMNLNFTILHHHQTVKTMQGYSFTDILGYPQSGQALSQGSSSGQMLAWFLSTSLFHSPERWRFFIGDYVGISSGIGYTINKTEFQSNSQSEKSIAGHFGFLGGIAMGYDISDDVEVAVRAFYDFQDWHYYLGDGMFDSQNDRNLIPFTRNVQLAGRWQRIGAEATFGGYFGHLNGQSRIRYQTFQLLLLPEESKKFMLGLRFHHYAQPGNPERETDVKMLGIGASFGWQL